MKKTEFIEKFETDYNFAIKVIDIVLDDNLDVTDRNYFISRAVKEGIYSLNEDVGKGKYSKEEVREIKKLAQQYDVVIEVCCRGDAQANNYENAIFKGYDYEKFFKKYNKNKNKSKK